MQNMPIWGDLKHIHIKHVMHKIHIKWMVHIWEDKGQIWSQWIWPQIIRKIPKQVFPGMTNCAEHLVQHPSSFYKGIICSYAYVNQLDVRPNRPQNIWVTELVPKVNKSFITLGYIQTGDLLTASGVIDYRTIQIRAQ